MDRINGADFIDIGGGRRGFRSQNALAGINGTEVTDTFLNDVQEEICKVIEAAGLALDPENQQQLWEALQSIAAPGFANRTAWLPVLSMITTAPPNGAIVGDAYIIPAGATGAWAGNQQKLAEWTGATWRIVDTKNGHGVSLPDGRVFEKIGGTYIEKLAMDVQSGKWNYAVDTGSANSITANLSPALIAYTPGLRVHVKAAKSNTGPVTVNLNGLGVKDLVDLEGMALSAWDIKEGVVYTIVYDGAKFRTVNRSENSNQNITSNGWTKLDGGLIMQWGRFTGTTQSDRVANGVYESTPFSISWPMTFPNSLLQVVSGCGTDVPTLGAQEQAWIASSNNSGGQAIVAARIAPATLSGSFIVFGY